jgi:hypothetical protein
MITAFISKLVRSLTAGRVILWSLIGLCSIVLFTAYENRNQLFSKFVDSPVINTSGLMFSVGPETKNSITAITLANRDIVGIGVLNVNLRQNESTYIYLSTSNKALAIVQPEGSHTAFPSFTNLQDGNEEIIRLINGQFSCSKFAGSLLSKIYPELDAQVAFTCKSSIPSYYGYFSGYIVVFIKNPLSLERESQLKISIEKLANEVYFRDVLPTQHREKQNAYEGNTK